MRRARLSVATMVAQRACDPCLIRLIEMNAMEFELAPHATQLRIGDRLCQVLQETGGTVERRALVAETRLAAAEPIASQRRRVAAVGLPVVAAGKIASHLRTPVDLRWKQRCASACRKSRRCQAFAYRNDINAGIARCRHQTTRKRWPPPTFTSFL